MEVMDDLPFTSFHDSLNEEKPFFCADDKKNRTMHKPLLSYRFRMLNAYPLETVWLGALPSFLDANLFHVDANHDGRFARHPRFQHVVLNTQSCASKPFRGWVLCLACPTHPSLNCPWKIFVPRSNPTLMMYRLSLIRLTVIWQSSWHATCLDWSST